MIIGFLNLLNLASAIYKLDAVQIALRFFTAVWFTQMVRSDSKSRRFAFMVFYATEVVIYLCLEIFMLAKVGTDLAF